MTAPTRLPLLVSALAALAFGLAVAGPLASRAAAQNPLARGKQEAPHPFAGVYTGEGVRLELRWDGANDRYDGRLVVDGDACDATATERDGALTGTFVDGGARYEFGLRARGDRFVLTSDGNESELVRAAAADGPARDRGEAGEPAPPDAPDGLPAWLRAGARATYFTGSAQIPGFGVPMTEDDQGNWTDGRATFRLDGQGTGGAGFTQYDIVAAAADGIVVSCTSFVYADAQLSTLTRTGTQAFVGDRNGLGELWVPPATLRAMREENRNGRRVRRLRYPLDGRTYDAITTQVRDQSGYTRYTYDLETGLLLVHAHCAAGAAPNGNGGGGGAVTTIVQNRLRSLRTVAMPWTGHRTPEWVRQGQRFDYRGTMRNSQAEGLLAPWSYGFTIAIDRTVAGGAVATLTSALDYGYGQPPQETTGQVGYGPGAPIGLWLDGQALQRLQPGQVLDRDPITKNEIVFVGRDGGTATLAERSSREQQTYTYDLRNGQLVATTVRAQQGPATLTIDTRLVR